MNPDLKIIENIKNKTIENKLNDNVSIDDPDLTEEELLKLVDKYNKIKKNKVKYNIDKKAVDKLIKTTCKDVYNNIKFEGLEKLNDITGAAIITSNHYSPVDTIPIMELIKKVFNKNIYIVSYASNLALKAPLDYITNHKDLIPLINSVSYINNVFTKELFDKLDNNEFVLIYPEQEMWNNYKKPRPCKRGAYQFATMKNVPIISLFTELRELDEDSDEHFKKLEYIVHVLGIIRPNPNLTLKQNSVEMSKKDYELKVKAYEKIYNRKLDYNFLYSDIAGLKKEFYK